MTGSNCSARSPDDQKYEYYMFPSVSIIALIIGLPGNLAALYYFTVKITPRSAFSVYITNLALRTLWCCSLYRFESTTISTKTTGFLATLFAEFPVVYFTPASRRISMIKTKMAQKAVGVIYAILAITVLCLLPYHLVYLLHVLGHMNIIQSCPVIDTIHIARRVTIALAIFNTCLDPVLYYITTGHCKWLQSKWCNKRITKRRGVYVIGGMI
ncbi:hypothetical protein WMY93_017743 [Mugilogobius chulae]|uniref:G-protein coupled receptors family 1 profile domain-containing protein n=1 Tax=Mugilogobius chulae TaxID=88201 RepID=A0AAW0NW87_9GOBI